LFTTLGSEPDVRPIFEVRLETAIDSKSVAGSELQAAVVSPAIIDGKLYLPTATKIYGKVIRNAKVGFGLRHERAELEILFFQAQFPDGRRTPISTTVVSLDNAREEVRQGLIKGILAADSLTAYLFGVWHRPTLVLPHRALLGLTGVSGMTWGRVAPSPIGAAAFIGLRYALVPWPNPEIRLPVGTELRLRLESISDTGRTVPAEDGLALDEAVNRSLEARPFRITKAGGEAPGDVVNIAFLGSRADIINAFQRAGWQTADLLNHRSFRDAYRAFTTSQGYATASVSDLRYQGQPPALVFQKSFNTISKRHHIRIWAAESSADQTLWLGAASPDVGVDFDSAKLTFSHRIDEHLDVERAKVINDLGFVQCLDGVAFVGRPAVAAHAVQARKTQTDGRLAVAFLGSCTGDAPAFSNSNFESARPRLPYRLAQRTILETRNYLLRRNAYYQTYWFVRRSGVLSRFAGASRTVVADAQLQTNSKPMCPRTE
jgi:hypothetical protein